MTVIGSGLPSLMLGILTGVEVPGELGIKTVLPGGRTGIGGGSLVFVFGNGVIPFKERR